MKIFFFFLNIMPDKEWEEEETYRRIVREDEKSETEKTQLRWEFYFNSNGRPEGLGKSINVFSIMTDHNQAIWTIL